MRNDRREFSTIEKIPDGLWRFSTLWKSLGKKNREGGKEMEKVQEF